MTFKIKLKKLHLRLWLPTFSAAGIAIECAKKNLEKSGYSLKKSRMLKRNIRHAIKRAKKQIGSFELLNVSSDGVKISIRI